MIDGDLFEAYQRQSRASKEELEKLGLDPENPPKAKMGAPFVNEYIQLIGFDIAKNGWHEWKVAELGTDIEIDNVYVQTPTQDNFDLEIYNRDGNKLLDLSAGRSRNGLELPNSLLTQDLRIRIFAREFISIVVINCRPAVLLTRNFGMSSSSQPEFGGSNEAA